MATHGPVLPKVASDHGLFSVASLMFEAAASSSPYGSGPAGQPRELIARNLPVELGCHKDGVLLAGWVG